MGPGAAATLHGWDRRVALGTDTIERTTKHERLALLSAPLFRAQVIAQTTT